MENALKRFWEANRRVIVICLIATFVWGLAAHGYHFLNFNYSHDTLDGIYTGGYENDHKTELGRGFSPVYRYLIRGLFTMPWITGLLALLWIAMAVYFVVRIFDVKSAGLMVLISGVMTVNLTVIAVAATYMFDFDVNMCAMMLSCLAAWLWRSRTRGWFVLGAVCVGVGMGMYQSYVTATIALVMMALLMDLMDGKKPLEALKQGVMGALMVLLGTGVYFVSIELIGRLFGVELIARTNTMVATGSTDVSSIADLIKGVYTTWWDYFFNPHSSYLVPGTMRVINMALMVFAAFVIIRTLVRRDVGVLAKVLFVGIAALLPLGMNVFYVLASGFLHDLMKYSFALFYVLCLLWMARQPVKPVKWACCALSCVMLWSGVQTANTVYFKKEMIWDATYSRMTNVVYDMLYYGYVPGETEVFISGNIPFGSMTGFEEVDEITGVDHNNAITRDQKSIRSYFQYVFGDKMVFATEEQQESIMATEDFEYMSRWPDEGYITIVDDVMVVKLN